MFKIKKAFTLAEIMIMITVVAIVMTMVVETTKPFAPKFKSLYYYAFSNTRKFAGEMLAISTDKQIEKNDSVFCSSLVDMLNTVGGASTCGPMYSANKNTPFQSLTESALDHPTFTLSNGQRYYISPRVEELPLPYRILSVDLNGKSSPNKLSEDVVSFLMFDNGEVFPLGSAAEDIEYLMVSNKIYSLYSGRPNGQVVKTSDGSSFLGYREGFCTAGISSVYSDYCNSGGTFTTTIAVNPACGSDNKNTFCRVNIIKPVINVKI